MSTAKRGPVVGQTYVCKRCKRAGIEPPFEGTTGELAAHTKAVHIPAVIGGAPKDSPAAAPVDVDAPASAAGDTPGEDYTRPDERVPGGARVRVEGDDAPAGNDAPRTSWKNRLWGNANAERAERPMRTREVRPVRKRVDATDVWSFLWKFAGHRLEKTELDIVVGRCMVYQAPVAGAVLEELAKDSLIDKLIQPLARKSAELETAAALFMLPALLATLERNPQMAPVLLPSISDAIEVHLYAMVPIIKSERKKKEQRADALRELYPDALEGTDPVLLVLSEMFAGTVFETGFSPENIAEAQAQADAAQRAAAAGAPETFA